MDETNWKYTKQTKYYTSLTENILYKCKLYTTEIIYYRNEK